MKNIFAKLKPYIRRVVAIVEIRYVFWAILTVVGAELLSTGFISAVTYPFARPLPFLAAVFIVLTTYSVSLLFKKRIGVFILLEGIWIGISIANCVLLSYRVNPLSAVDFSILFSVLSIITVYLSIVQLILIGAAILAALAIVIYCIVRLPSKKPNYKKVIAEILICIILCTVAVAAAVIAHRSDIKKLKLAEAYEEYGFVFCFSLSTADRGIDKPHEYSENSISDILDELEHESNTAEDMPNIVIVQLESFMDTRDIIGLETSADPITNFRKLKEAYPSGKLSVPVAGAGTVNTEFEILCGIPISNFGLGEYPYETVLRDNPCESIAYYLSELGYTSHAIHNHTGTFYNRHTVMENLGFDTFTPVEFMSNVKRNSLGWAKDGLLTDEIMTALSSTDNRDFVYTISVQPHGKYVSESGDYGDIKVTGDFRKETLAAMEFYVNQLSETDQFVGDLITQISMSGEDTVVVFFGDHQPSLGLSGEDLECGSIYTTEYVIWNNFGLDGDNIDLASYELSSYLLDVLNMEGGIISRLHRDMHDDERYLDVLEELAYDLLFGDMYAYGGEFPYEIPEITYGVRKISAEGAYIHNETLYIMGEALTEASCAIVDGRERDTIYINPNLIVCSGVKSADEVYVAQIARDGTEFSRVSCPMREE